MRKSTCLVVAMFVCLSFAPALAAAPAAAADTQAASALDAAKVLPPAHAAASLEQVQKYERAIHIMAMLLVGFGFLMVFVRGYGRSALTATFLLVGLSAPMYFLLNHNGLFGPAADTDVDRLLMAEFAAASLLICAGAVLGRLKMWQYLLLGAIFVPCYMANEWVLLEGGLGLLPKDTFLDTGGSIVIHAFGALFGFGAMLALTTRKQFDAPLATDATSDRYSLLGSMVLWVFWPSFCSALVSPHEVPGTAINVIFALCGSTLATYIIGVLLRRKISPADIANATLAGGVAIGATCRAEDFYTWSLAIGAIAGGLSTFGFAVIQPRLQAALKKVDTCGVLYLHGLPGLMGGLAAAVVVPTRSTQLIGILLVIPVAVAAGFIGGQLIAFTGRRQRPYEDEQEMIVEEAPAAAAEKLQEAAAN